MITKEELDQLLLSFNKDIVLVAVSKTHSIDRIKDAIKLGIVDFGENKLQELKSKYDYSLKVNWHFIGHIQTNKIKEIVKYASLIHSVDRIEVVDLINKEAIKMNKVMPILIQVNILNEENKSGIDPQQLPELLEHTSQLSNIALKGLMVIGPTNQNESETAKVFSIAKELFNKYQEIYPSFKYLSMGMSDDYPIAIKYGSNMIRIGSKIFGERY